LNGRPRPGPEFLALLAALSGLLLLYAPLVIQDPVLSRDDRSLLAPLRQVRSPAGYVAAVREGRILDLQPLRDLSLWLDLQVKALTGASTFHLTNLLLLGLIALVLFRALTALGVQREVCAVVAVCFALHPVLIGSTAWISARKHLLCGLFAALATVAVLRERPWRGVVFYLLSILSQPISLLWPLWMLVRSRRARAPLTAPLTASLAMLVCAAANAAYYSGPYLRQTGGASKLVAAGPGSSLLAVGRSVFNLLCPVALSAVYDPGSPWNLAGLLLLPLFVWLALRVAPRAFALEWLLFAALPLSVVTVRMTNIFVSDTYLLLPAFGLACLLAKIAERLSRRTALAVACAVPAAFVALGVPVARSWASDAALWHRAWAVEPSPVVAAKEAFYLADEGRLDQAWAALEVASLQAGQRPFGEALAHVALLDSRLSPGERLRRLRAWPALGAWHHYALAVLLAQTGQFAEADVEARLALHDSAALGGDFSVVAAESVYFCLRAGRPDCAAVRERLANDRALDTRAFQARLSALQVR
jgi:hypothetical protein